MHQRAAALRAASRQRILTTPAGVRLEAWIAEAGPEAPVVVLIHGWLGHADAGYVLSAGAELFGAGFSVVRLNLRDHGDTAHLNEELFNSARIEEVVDAVRLLRDEHPQRPLGIAGFSLGGNFALRVARQLALPTVAVCPALCPAATMRRIDDGWIGYRLYFVGKWRRALKRKQEAFPHRYRFDEALALRSVSALTDLFVDRYTGYERTEEYFDAYRLTGDTLAETQASVVYAKDDPVIPAAHFEELPSTVAVTGLDHGGHCAFLTSPAQPSWVDDYLVSFFRSRLA